MSESGLPANVGSMEGLGVTREAVLRELDDATNQTWIGKRSRWAALVRAQDAEIQRLREHAVILAETARQVEQERCAKLCDANFEQHATNGFPREASTARALAARIRDA